MTSYDSYTRTPSCKGVYLTEIDIQKTLKTAPNIIIKSSTCTQSKQVTIKVIVQSCVCHLYCFIALFAINCTNQIKSNYLNSHGKEAQEKPPGL